MRPSFGRVERETGYSRLYKRIGRKKRVMSAAARAKIGKATRERWARFRAAKAKGKR